MTPQHPAPSVHNVVTGFFVPNSSDGSLQTRKKDFGTTILIMAQDQKGLTTDECKWNESANAVTRGIIYSDLLNLLGLESEEGLSCKGLRIAYGGAGK